MNKQRVVTSTASLSNEEKIAVRKCSEPEDESSCPAAARVGINLTPTVAECCKRLIINCLHYVGLGFISE